MIKEHLHFKLYKPYGYISQLLSNDERQSRKKKFLSALYNFPTGIMPIGRLDEKSEGLILLTTDGKLSNTINQSGIEKEYYAQVDGVITAEAIQTLCAGVGISVDSEKYKTMPCEASQLIVSPELPPPAKKIRDDRHGPTSWIRIVLKEGKFRQVRKMTAAVGFPTLRLIRVRIGKLTLNTLQLSEVAPLTTEEVNYQILQKNTL